MLLGGRGGGGGANDKERVLLEKVTAVTLEDGKMTTGRRSSPVQQVQYNQWKHTIWVTARSKQFESFEILQPHTCMKIVKIIITQCSIFCNCLTICFYKTTNLKYLTNSYFPIILCNCVLYQEWQHVSVYVSGCYVFFSLSWQQLKCVGGTAGCYKFRPKVVQCINRGFDGYDVQVWHTHIHSHTLTHTHTHIHIHSHTHTHTHTHSVTIRRAEQ